MSKSHEKQTFTNVRHRVAIGAAILAGAMGPGVANAEAHAKKHAHHHAPARVEHGAKARLHRAEAVTQERMLRGESVAFLRGDVIVQESLRDRIDPEITHGVSINIKNALLVDIAHPNVQKGFKGIEVGHEYAIGFMDQTGDVPKVTLVPFDQNRMSFLPEAENAGPNIQYAFFQRDRVGGLNFQDPLVSYDGLPHGGPLEDPAGNREPVGRAYEPMK